MGPSAVLDKTLSGPIGQNQETLHELDRALIPAKGAGVADGYPRLVGLHYHAVRCIGEGSFGVIFEGYSDLNGRKEPRKSSAPQLRDEFRYYKLLSGIQGIPSTYYFGQEGMYNCLVMELLGPSLEEMFDRCGRRFSVPTVCRIAIQLLDRLQDIHSRSLVYRDIKPDNFLLGLSGPTICIVDFGMAKPYVDSRTSQHIPFRDKKALSGTARYMSINTHLGREQSRRDDLEALGHVLLYFLRGSLPWQGLKANTNKEKYELIGRKKQDTLPEELCSGHPDAFGHFLNYARTLAFEQEPDYRYCKELFRTTLETCPPTEHEYDWMRMGEVLGGRRAVHEDSSPNMSLGAQPSQKARVAKGPPDDTTAENVQAGWFRNIFCFCLL